MTKAGRYRGFDPDGVAESEADYFGYCPVCGAYIDTRDLDQVLAHVHDAEIEIGEGPEPPAHMPGGNETGICDFCRRGMVVKAMQELAFRQRTRKGYVSCRVNIPVLVCADCGAISWVREADAIMDEAVNREGDRL